MRVEYELDQWEWQGTSRSIDVDPEDYQDMSAADIKQAVYDEIRKDTERNLHLVYAEDEVAREILEHLQTEASDDEAGDAS